MNIFIPSIFSGVVTREIFTRDGILLFSETKHNTIVDNGIMRVRDAICGVSPGKATNISIGVGAMEYTQLVDSTTGIPITLPDGTPVMGWVFKEEVPQTDTALWEFYANPIPGTTVVTRDNGSSYTVVSDFSVAIDARVCEAVIAFEDGSIFSKQMFSPTSVDAAARLAASTGYDPSGQPAGDTIILRLTWRIYTAGDADLQGKFDPDFGDMYDNW